MNVLFLTIGTYDSIDQKGGYADLFRCFVEHGHRVYAVVQRERRSHLKTELLDEGDAKTLKVRVGNITKTNLLEKGLSTICIGHCFKKAIQKNLIGIRFDLIIYTTPPITLAGLVADLKRAHHADTYLLLKDIFPQNAVDIGLMKQTGITSFLYSYFRRKEKYLYRVSDQIGCMSQANVAYVLEHNPHVKRRNDRAFQKSGKGIVQVCPNCIEPQESGLFFSIEERKQMREAYGIPPDKKVFVYGGNLGKPQGIPFMMKCLYSQRKNARAFFVIVGNGTEFGRIVRFMENYRPPNVKLMKSLPKDEYDRLLGVCDVGMIFLDHKFTIPNFPSRLLGYMQAKLPVLAVTDTATDIGDVIVENQFGWWCESNDLKAFHNIIATILQTSDKALEQYAENGFSYMQEHYHVRTAYETIVRTTRAWRRGGGCDCRKA